MITDTINLTAPSGAVVFKLASKEANVRTYLEEGVAPYKARKVILRVLSKSKWNETERVMMKIMTPVAILPPEGCEIECSKEYHMQAQVEFFSPAATWGVQRESIFALMNSLLIAAEDNILQTA